MSSTVTGYSRAQIILHWVIAALILFQILGKGAIVEFTQAVAKGLETDQIPLLARVHVLLGILVLVLAIWRVYLRLTRGVPGAPADESPAQKAVAGIVHWSLYAVIFLMPLSGMAAWFGGVELAARFHATFKFFMIAIIGLHILGALFQQYVQKTGILKRMMKAE